ncbi:hypothetical protein JTB14_026730 [Gonioctena quinquepunctata]|nr:hypothetical protein JTB14_026730 [Gonioctena quinquepunctata]
MTEIQRVENEILQKHLKKSLEPVSYIAFIRGNGLVVNVIGEEETDISNVTQASSVPQTPIITELSGLYILEHQDLTQKPILDRPPTTCHTSSDSKKTLLPSQVSPKSKKKQDQEFAARKTLHNRNNLKSSFRKNSNS